MVALPALLAAPPNASDDETVNLRFGTLTSGLVAGERSSAKLMIEETIVPPTFDEGMDTTRMVPENTASGTNIGSPITASDDDGDTLNYSLSGTDHDWFTLGRLSGQIRTFRPLNFESKNSYSVTVNADDRKGGTDSIRVTINVTDVNEKPEIADQAPPRFAENGTGPVATYTADDPENDEITWELQGDDGSDFTISSRGALRFVSSPDHENPHDADTNNEYEITIRASDGALTDDRNVTVTVTNVNEPPTLDSPIADQTISASVSRIISLQGRFSDPDDDTLTYTASSDATGVATASINSVDGTLTIAALTVGSATITVTAADRSSGQTDRMTAADKFKVTVEPNAPAKVTGLTGTPGSVRGTIDLDWDPADRADGYEVAQWRQRLIQPDHWVVLDSTEVTIDASNSSAVVRGLTGGETYKHRVRGIKGTGSSRVEGEWSDEVVTTLTLPAKVQGLVGAPSTNSREITLNWNAGSGAKWYQVRQREHHDFPRIDNWTVLRAIFTGPTATVANLDPEKTYVYQVRGTNVHGEGEWSDATPAIAVRPDTPQGLMTDVMIGGRGINFAWDPVDGARGYEISVAPSASSHNTAAKGDSVEVTGLTPGTTYTFNVLAWHTNGGGRLYSPPPVAVDDVAPTPESRGHQADHKVKYVVGNIGNRVIEHAIPTAVSEWNSKARSLGKGLQICTGAGCVNPDGFIATVKTVDKDNAAVASDPNDWDAGCGGSRGCVKATIATSSAGRHREDMAVIFEDPPWFAEKDRVGVWQHKQYEWNAIKARDDSKVPGSGSPGVFYVYGLRIVLHEFGHTLGLPEFYLETTALKKFEDAVMHEGYEIHKEDIEQLRAIYLLHNPH